MTEFSELLKILQGGGNAALVAIVWLLWKIDKSLTVMRVSNEILTETLLRLVPGFKRANEDARKDVHSKEAVPNA